MLTFHATEQLVEAIVVDFLRAISLRKRLWARTEHGLSTFWLVTEPISDAQEIALHAVNRRVYERVPDARFAFIIVNPALFADGQYRYDLPPDAREIALD